MYIRSILLLALLFVTSANALEKNICEASLNFVQEPVVNKSIINVSPSVKLEIEQNVETHFIADVQVATNVLCQKLVGAGYTNSPEEWQNFFQNTLNSLQKRKMSGIQATVIGTDHKSYNGSLPNREYKFSGIIDNRKHIIYNAAILDLNKNTMYIVSVSGLDKVENALRKEFVAIVGSMKLTND